MIAIPENIETRQAPPELLKESENTIRKFFNANTLTLSKAEYICTDFFGIGMGYGKKKEEKFENAIDRFLFKEPGSFDLWFSARPPEARRILYAVVFENIILFEMLEKALNMEIKLKNEKWSSRRLDPRYNLDFLTLYNAEYYYDTKTNKKKSLGIKIPYRAAILPRLVPPPEASFEYCISAEADTAYNNSAGIAETLPLLCNVLSDVLTEEGDEKNLMRGFSKKIVKKIYTASGLPPFPLETEKVAGVSPLSADMIGHFLMFISSFTPGLIRTINLPETLKHYFNKFLDSNFELVSYRYEPKNYFEYDMFFGHINKGAQWPRDLAQSTDETVTRNTLRGCLIAIAKDGRTFDACALIKHLKYSGKILSGFSTSDLQSFKIKAETVSIDGYTSAKEGWESLNAATGLRFDFIEKPLFLGYFYLCASLGILEITQEPPPFICERANKKMPISIFDGLKTVKITDFGRWCLGIISEPPEFEKSKYEAIADSELFLVTVRGRSLERTLFLDNIGEKLGADRWRVNPGTFISGCGNKTQIEERINKFHALIESNPAPHWEALFNTVRDRADIFNKCVVDAIVYQLPSDNKSEREAVSELLADPELRAIAMRAEGGLLVVAHRNEKRFYTLLAAHGIAHFESARWG
ncbi:MAG: hypothetical protein LBK66_15005 [Spirochaetaceae bacterium]|jgi:hypothetical protein|nr:hypothetical protein [Spirochaetaceae bacterium]